MPRILHIHSEWSGSAAARRCRAVAIGLGSSLRHDVVVVGGIGANQPPRSPFSLRRDFPKLTGAPTLGKLQKIAKAMLGYDLVCSYGYEATNAAMAHTAYSEAFSLPPLIHHEDEHARRGTRADIFRRLALGKSAGLVVPDERIEEAALVAWQQPMGRVKLIPEGIDLKPWRRPPPADMLRAVVKRPGEKWVGLLADNTKEVTQVLPAFAPLTDNWQLVVFGADLDAQEARQAAEAQDIAHRVHLAGEIDSDARAIGLCDITVIPENIRDCGLSTIRAMASGAVVIAEPQSEAAPLLPDESREFVASLADRDELEVALGTLASDQGLRESLSEAGKAQAKAHHDEKKMIATYKRLYASAMKLAGL